MKVERYTGSSKPKDYTPDGYIRTTFYLKKELKSRIQQEALLQRRTITSVINETVENYFALWEKLEEEQAKLGRKI